MSQTLTKPPARTETEIEEIDDLIVELIGRRIELAAALMVGRVVAGLPEREQQQEIATTIRYRKLGSGGGELGVLVLRLCRSAAHAT